MAEALSLLDQSPAVSDFGKRFWVYQMVDIRTDSFADLAAMYGTKLGFYLLIGPGLEERYSYLF